VTAKRGTHSLKIKNPPAASQAGFSQIAESKPLRFHLICFQNSWKTKFFNDEPNPCSSLRSQSNRFCGNWGRNWDERLEPWYRQPSPRGR
jgi:hypothetical protein